ncbi:MAG: hypothetical protein JOZ16_01295 [Methylobacteriaceae bacterium]|nr:hypothetical protein [Methylobacteriaceae bacterium]
MPMDREQENFVSRRNVLPIAAAALAGVAAMPAAAAPSSRLAELINVHSAAKAAFDAACERLGTIDDAFDAAEPVKTIPVLIDEEHGRILLSHRRDDVRAQLASSYARRRAEVIVVARGFPGDAIGHLLPLLVAKEAENLQLLEQAFSEEDARREAFGLAAAEREYERGNEIEREALLAVCAFRCSTLAEARTKAAYLAELEILTYDEDFLAAFLQSFVGGDDA